MRLRLLLFLIFFYHVNLWSQVIDVIKFTGVSKTDTIYLSKIIESKVGHLFDLSTVESDLQVIKNLNLFFSVGYSVNPSERGGVQLEFRIEEAVYLYPLLSIAGFKNQLKLQFGGSQINFLGRAQSIGFVYQYYDRHSFSAYYSAPRHSNSITGHELALSIYSTVEPLYFVDTVSNFNFDNYSFSLGGFYWLTKRMRLGVGGALMYEKYEQIDDVDLGFPNNSFNFNKYQIYLKLDYLGLDQHFEFFQGTSNSIYAETIQTALYPEASFFKLTNELKFFKRLGDKGNLGLLSRVGLSTNNFSPFAPFVLDSFKNLRGIGNRLARGTGEFILSAEYRYTAISRKYFFLQLATFCDYGVIRYPGDTFLASFQDHATNIFIGGGIRFHSRLFYKSIFRLDFSMNPTETKQNGFTFGIGHYF